MQTHINMPLSEQGDNLFEVILVGFLPTGNGCSCVCHPFGCGNSLVLERDLHDAGVQNWLKIVGGNNLGDTRLKAMVPMVAAFALQLHNMPLELLVRDLMVLFFKLRM